MTGKILLRTAGALGILACSIVVAVALAYALERAS
jgi:hypothetical protein